jgi:hypothetical protein
MEGCEGYTPEGRDGSASGTHFHAPLTGRFRPFADQAWPRTAGGGMMSLPWLEGWLA